MIKKIIFIFYFLFYIESTLPTIPAYPVTATTTTTSSPPPPALQHYSSNDMMSPSRDTTKPLLHSILQTETATPFTKKPSSVYQIEFTSHIYNPEAINSMATSSSVFTPTKPSIRPISIKATTATTTATANNGGYFAHPELHMPWPVYNLIIEGHSKVKTYGSKNDDPLGNIMPKIRPIQPNPIVERVTDTADDNNRPEYTKQKIKTKQTAMTSLLSLLDGSFGNFLSDSGGDAVEQEENQQQIEVGSKRKTRSIDYFDVEGDEKQERVVGVSFQVDERPQIYRKGTVVSETLWPSSNAADSTR